MHDKIQISHDVNPQMQSFIEQYKNKIYNGDCLEFMKQVPDKFFDLVLTDPPYGIADKLTRDDSTNNNNKFGKLYNATKWHDEKPTQEVFDEIFRISKNQIIWGGELFWTSGDKRGFMLG